MLQLLYFMRISLRVGKSEADREAERAQSTDLTGFFYTK